MEIQGTPLGMPQECFGESIVECLLETLVERHGDCLAERFRECPRERSGIHRGDNIKCFSHESGVIMKELYDNRYKRIQLYNKL